MEKAGAFPKSLLSRFPEYNLSTVNLKDFKWIIIERVLEAGTRREVRWLFSQYDSQDFVEFLKKKAPRRLSRQSLVFWSLFFNLPISPKLKNPLWER